MQWTAKYEGSFNNVYRNGIDGNGKLIFKLIKEKKTPLKTKPVDIMDNYARSVRIWNEINPHLPPARIEVAIIDGIQVTGWVSPFIEGTKPSEAEICAKLIDIFNKTGRIIVDATAKNNFIKTPSGEIECIDIGMAVQLEEQDEASLIGLRRRSSFSSLETWDQMAGVYTDWFVNEEYHATVPQIIQTVKALLFIKTHRRDIVNADFLRSAPDTLAILSKAYDMENPHSNHPEPTESELDSAVYAAEHLLVKKEDLSLESLKQFCRDRITRVITPDSSPRSPDYTAFNTHYALELLKKVNQCKHMTDIAAIYDTIMSLENMIDAESTALLSEPLQQPAIRQINQTLLMELEHSEDLFVSKQNCLQILTQFLSQHGHMGAEELAVLKNQFSKPPQEKIQYYKNQIEHTKLPNREKEVLKLIKWIDNAATIEEVDEFIVKFEKNIPPPVDLSALSCLEYIYHCFRPATLDERLSQCLSQCKLVIASAQSASVKGLMHHDIAKGPDQV